MSDVPIHIEIQYDTGFAQFYAMPDSRVEIIVRRSLTTLLHQGSVERIREFFWREEILGLPGRAYTCPVARFVTRELGMNFGVTCVTSDMVSVVLKGVRVPTPELIAAFTRDFDKRPGALLLV